VAQVSQNPQSFAPQQQDQGNPFMGFLGQAIGTFLPMAFGLPPMPFAGNMLGGLMGGGQGQQNPFGGLLTPFGQQMAGPMLGGIVNPLNPWGAQNNFGHPQEQPGHYDPITGR
jgi:hypothetical protein